MIERSSQTADHRRNVVAAAAVEARAGLGARRRLGGRGAPPGRGAAAGGTTCDLADIFGRASLLPSGYRETGDWSRDGGADLNGRKGGDVSPAAAELAEAARALLH